MASLGRAARAAGRRPGQLAFYPLFPPSVRGGGKIVGKTASKRRAPAPAEAALLDDAGLPSSSAEDAPAMTLGGLDSGSASKRRGRGEDGPEDVDYARETILDIARSRTGWLVAFCIGLLLAALVVEQFEDVLEHHVELSFFVPLIMGHGGNTGSQSVTTVIRALALKQVTNKDVVRVVLKEAGAGCMMGAVLGLAILGFSCIWSGISTQVGATVAIALPLVSLWANGLGAFLTLLADRLKVDPAVTSVPLLMTIVDSTGLVLYFYIAQIMLS
ncbi:magnesium transporter [Raphidocelis subcapitata]|uniref:Magnesium transporter n=1 Tax=Raphidocelis subcapitata TaxID=307507 RepID=A0A2V0NV62_9CHLO|nr:magnesium transporter [Raphidocelis subcapitata]|eukprot:GBF91501.1 magnesium transporter [Raphidocelis subcapitata]